MNFFCIVLVLTPIYLVHEKRLLQRLWSIIKCCFPDAKVKNSCILGENVIQFVNISE